MLYQFCFFYCYCYRQEVIERLQSEHSVVILVTNSLTNYMDKVRQLVKENPEIDANTFMPDGRYNHIMQVQERLNFLRFLLKVYSRSQDRTIMNFFKKMCITYNFFFHRTDNYGYVLIKQSKFGNA